jgi:phosphatidate cytidylyltransferase
VLRLRFLSAFVGVPILVGIAVVGGWVYVVTVAVASVIAMLEIARMLAGAGFRPVVPLGVALALGIVLDALASDVRVLPAILVVSVLAGLFSVMRRSDTDGAIVDWALTVAGASYVGGTMHYFIPLRSTPDGAGVFWVLTVLICTWTCDITAFFVGRRWGRARLAPRISPGKSVEGAVGGVVGTVLVALALGPLLTAILTATGLTVLPSPSFVRLAGLGATVAVCAVVGDLTESFVKRQCGAKDSGDLIPGHGGILDRIDSVLLASVGAYFYVVMTA